MTEIEDEAPAPETADGIAADDRSATGTGEGAPRDTEEAAADTGSAPIAVPEDTGTADAAGTSPADPSPTAPVTGGTDLQAALSERIESRAEAPGADDSAEAEAAPEAAASPDDGALASLVFRVNDDCWLMVRDARNWLVYSSVAAGGDILRLSGLPPFQVVAGYPSALEVEYEGEPYDLSPHIRPDGTTARFQIPR